ncbi:hypothetical protein GCM10028819_32190 [Spirosoma humi]
MTISEQVFGLQPGQPNAGFIRTLWLLRAVDVVDVLEPHQLPVAGQPHTVSKSGLLVRVGSKLSKLSLPAKTGTFDESSLREAAGTVYTQTLQLPLPRSSAALDHYLGQNAVHRWVAFWIDYNGQGWLAGRPDNGLRLTTTRLQAASNGIQLTLVGKSHLSIYRLEGTDPAVLFPDSAFDFGFNLSFDS